MILKIHDQLRKHVNKLLISLYDLDSSELPQVAFEYPPNRDFGDLGTPVAFELAKRLRKSPRSIAQELADAFGSISGVARVVPAANGYLNVYLIRPDFLLSRVAASGTPSTSSTSKAIVEHTAINPNKAAHVGHLRNAALGDTLVRVLRYRGLEVETQNYIDDTGVQVADVVVGFRKLERQTLETVRKIASTTRFDHYCWDLYAKVTDWYGQDKERLAIRGSTLHDIERGNNDNAEMAAFVAEQIVRCHLKTMLRINVDYDLLTWEGDILRLEFWSKAFALLKKHNAIYLSKSGTHAGCWVMSIQENPESTTAEDTNEEREKVIVRSNGTVTYIGKDIAYQFWKFGLLDGDFNYRVLEEELTSNLWTTCTANGNQKHPPFGKGLDVYNVIDVRQSYLQKLLKQALVAIGSQEKAARSHHFSYEMVALSHATAHELGYLPDKNSANDKRPFVEVSGRKGLGVKADDLLDKLAQKATDEVQKRNPQTNTAETTRIGSMIAVAAVRYFMVKFSRSKIIAFDLDEALSFEGESGPYVQYAIVRANNIFKKLRQRENFDESKLLAKLPLVPADELNGLNGNNELWKLVLEAARLDEIVEQIVRSLEFSVLAKYTFSLAQDFNAFYHHSSILNEERDDVREWREAAILYVRQQLTKALTLMGIEVPPRM